jgi:hypothetical protein
MCVCTTFEGDNTVLLQQVMSDSMVCVLLMYRVGQDRVYI